MLIAMTAVKEKQDSVFGLGDGDKIIGSTDNTAYEMFGGVFDLRGTQGECSFHSGCSIDYKGGEFYPQRGNKVPAVLAKRNKQSLSKAEQFKRAFGRCRPVKRLSEQQFQQRRQQQLKAPHKNIFESSQKWAVLDLNQRPPACRAGALTN